MPLDVGDGFSHVAGGGHVTETPAGHGEGLGETVDRNGAAADFFRDGSHGEMPRAVVNQLFINFVGDQVKVSLARQRR